jgi:hypothetical protein
MTPSFRFFSALPRFPECCPSILALPVQAFDQVIEVIHQAFLPSASSLDFEWAALALSRELAASFAAISPSSLAALSLSAAADTAFLAASWASMAFSGHRFY